MGNNKLLRKRRRGQVRQRERHIAKLEKELQRTHPDDGLIRKWRKEIEDAEREIERIDRRLPGRKHHGANEDGDNVA